MLMMDDLPESARRVQAALLAAGVETAVVELPASTRTAQEAASAIGCEVRQIAKSLVFRRKSNGEPVLVVASGTNRVDEQLVGRHLHDEIERADPEFVRAAKGYAIGGVPPLAHITPVTTLIVPDLLTLSTIWAAAGTPHAVFSISPEQLVTATGGLVMPVARRPG